MLKKLIAWFGRNEVLVLLVTFSLILRLPSLFEPYWYGDEGIYLTLGQALRKGLVWYRDIHDNKPPLLYLLAAFTGTVFWFRLLLMVWFGTAVAVFYRLCQKLLPQAPAAWATLAMIILTTIFEGNVANAEIFIVLPVTLGILLTFKPRPNYWLIGGLFSLGSLFKIPAAFDFLALTLWLVVWKKAGLKSLVQAGLGFAAPITLTIVYYAYRGGLEPYVRSALLQNVGYLQSWGGSQTGLITRFIITTIGLTIFIPLAKKLKLSAAGGLAIIWFAWAMFGALLSARPYPHYLIQPAIPLVILVTLVIFYQNKLLRFTALVAVGLAGLAYYQIRFWQYPILGYYQNFIAYSLRQKTKTEYYSWFDCRVNQTYRLAKYIRSTTTAAEPIFIWGDEPYVYALSQRLPVGRYTVAYHVVDFNGYSATIATLDRQRPKIIAVMTYESRDFPELKTRLATDYVQTATIDQAKIYRRLDGTE